MLVLSRKLNETIIINGNIHVTVLACRGNQVRLGIEAPGEIGIFREELCVPMGVAGVADEGGTPTASPGGPLHRPLPPPT